MVISYSSIFVDVLKKHNMSIEELKDVAIRVCGGESSAVKMLIEHIESMNSLIAAEAIHNNYGLNDIEILSLIMLEGFACTIIQQPAFNDRYLNEFNKILIDSLDKALLKIPKTSHDRLYRQDNFYHEVPQTREILKFNGFLTTSKDDFDNTYNIKWIIKPLSNELTKAHNIYNVYNHGYNCPYPEWQVEFERNTKFIVNEVVEKENKTEVFISELKD